MENNSEKPGKKLGNFGLLLFVFFRFRVEIRKYFQFLTQAPTWILSGNLELWTSGFHFKFINFQGSTSDLENLLILRQIGNISTFVSFN